MSTASKWLLGGTVTTASVVVLTLLYLIVGGGLLGLNVSSLDNGNGPYWPFTVVGITLIATFLFFIAWAIIFASEKQHRIRR